jgi:hypothetical protein
MRLLLLALLAAVSYGEVTNTLFVDDLLEHNTVNHTWMEIGYVDLTDTDWTTITTTVNNLNPGDAREMSVFMSLPEYGGETYSEGWPMVVKMNGRATRIAGGNYQFQARLVQPNDTYCPKLWWTPVASPAINVGWLIVEEGVYNITTSMLVFGSGEITRDNTQPMLKYDTPALYHAKYTMNYTTGCDPDDLDAVCEFVEKVSDFEPVVVPYKDVTVVYSATGWSHLGATNQLQTSVNKVPDYPDTELWMNTRVRNVFPDRIVMMLAVHSVFVNNDNPTALHGPYNYNFTLYPDYADIHTPEIASYFVWEKNIRLTCIEGLVMETSIQFPITDQPLTMEYFYDFEDVPGLFGMIGTLNSVGDTTSLRVFNRSLTGSSFITQEDQCTDEEERHHTAEAAFSMVVGKANLLGDTHCFIAYDVQPCEYVIYLYDLFMDGWDNVELVVDTGSEILKFNTSCGAKKITFTSLSCTWNAYMQTTDGAQPVTWWENYWRYAHVGLLGEETVYIGDYDSTITVVRETVTFTDLANTRLEAMENKCEQCKVAPPPPPKGAMGPGMGFGMGEGQGDGEGDGEGDNSANGGVADLTAGNIAPAAPDGVGVAPGDAGAPYGVLQITGVSAPIDSSAAPGANSFTVFYALNVVGLTSAVDSIAFYRGAAGINGPSMKSIDVTGLMTTFYVEGSFLVQEADIVHWINGEIYIQVNTANHLTGEIRAQSVLPTTWIEYYIYFSGGEGIDSSVLDGDGSGSSGNDDKSSGITGTDDNRNGGGHNKWGADDGMADGKGKNGGGKKAPKKGPVPVLIELFDDEGKGWYNNSGTWSYPVKVVGETEIMKDDDKKKDDDVVGDDDVSRRRLHPKLQMPPRQIIGMDYDIGTFPDILMYPTYVIMTADKTKQLHVGSLCPQRKIERCEERLPPNGEFVFRVMGKDPETDDHWKFCGVHGHIGQELQFEMKKGKCVPMAVVNAYTYCSFNTEVILSGSLVLAGVANDFSEIDSKVLENEVANMLVSTTRVSINSWHVNAEGNMEVNFEATIVAERHGVDGSLRENIDTLVSNLQSNIQSAFTSGAFMSSMNAAVAEYPESMMSITQATGASLTKLEIVNINYIEATTPVASRTPASLPYASAESEEVVVTNEEQGVSAIVVGCAIVGAVLVVAAFAIRVRRREEFVHQELAVDSEHADSIPEFDLGLEQAAAPRGLFFVSKERF